MKHLLLSLALIISANAWAENLRFGLSCKILDQIVMEMDEGKSKRYSAYEGELKTGDSFYIPPNVLHGAICTEAGELIDVFSPIREDFME